MGDNTGFKKSLVAALNSALPLDAMQSAYEQLRPQQRLWVDNYIACDDPIEAYLRVRPELREHKQAAYPRVHELVRNPIVQAAVRERQKELSGAIQISAQNIAQELAKVGFSNLKDFVRISANGDPYFELSDLTPEQWAAVGELTTEDFVDGRGDNARDVKRVKLKLHSKLDALEKLAKILGMYAPDKMDLTSGGERINSTTNVQVVVNQAMSPEDAAAAYARQLENG